MTDSSIFASGERRAMGLYDVCSFGFLFGLSMGMILAVFQVIGIVFVFMILLKSLVIMEIELRDKCLRWMGAMLSGPRALEGLEFFIAVWV